MAGALAATWLTDGGACVDEAAAGVEAGAFCAPVDEPTFARSKLLAEPTAGREAAGADCCGGTAAGTGAARAVVAVATWTGGVLRVSGGAVRSCWKPGLAAPDIGVALAVDADEMIVVVGVGVDTGRLATCCAGRIGGTAGRVEPGGTSSADRTVGRGTTGLAGGVVTGADWAGGNAALA